MAEFGDKPDPVKAWVLGNVRADPYTVPQVANGTRGSFIADIFRGAPNDPNSSPSWWRRSARW